MPILGRPGVLFLRDTSWFCPACPGVLVFSVMSCFFVRRMRTRNLIRVRQERLYLSCSRSVRVTRCSVRTVGRASNEGFHWWRIVWIACMRSYTGCFICLAHNGAENKISIPFCSDGTFLWYRTESYLTTESYSLNLNWFKNILILNTGEEREDLIYWKRNIQILIKIGNLLRSSSPFGLLDK